MEKVSAVRALWKETQNYRTNLMFKIKFKV